MLKSLSFSTRNHKFLFISDIHESHLPSWSNPPYQTRGFKSIGEYNDWIRSEWLRLVDIDTIVFNLGDTHFNDPKGIKFNEFTTWPCAAHYLINGNHLSGAKTVYRDIMRLRGIADDEELYPVKKNFLTFLGNTAHVYIDGKSVYMQHYAPFIWPEISKGGFALCGHSHGNCKEINPDCLNNGNILDVGVDNAVKYNNTPFFSWRDIQDIMKKKMEIKRDHH